MYTYSFTSHTKSGRCAWCLIVPHCCCLTQHHLVIRVIASATSPNGQTNGWGRFVIGPFSSAVRMFKVNRPRRHNVAGGRPATAAIRRNLNPLFWPLEQWSSSSSLPHICGRDLGLKKDRDRDATTIRINSFLEQSKVTRTNV